MQRWHHVCLILLLITPPSLAEDPPTRVFIFAGQSNMEGADSKIDDIDRFPPFRGLEEPQQQVRFAYCIGRQNKERSDGWVALQSVRQMVGPELSFAREVTKKIDAPIAIIKVAAGGTHLGGDWNPDDPQGFKMYPLLMEVIQSSLEQLTKQGIKYRIEGFMWHQGENDMFNEEYKQNYGANLRNFIARVRQDLKVANLPFYIGELCTKTIWGMDLRPRMYAISIGQLSTTANDPFATYVRTSQIGVEIGRPVGLHYHYGTLGQLQHGLGYAEEYLRSIKKFDEPDRKLNELPYAPGSRVKLFVLAGHRNMEGERAFVQDLPGDPLLQDNPQIAFRYSLGGGFRKSNAWEPLGPTGYYDTFGPELSFAKTLHDAGHSNIAIAKFTHSGSQMNDWTPEGSIAKTRHIYHDFHVYVHDCIDSLASRGFEVDVQGIFYHVGENEMSMPPYRQKAAGWLGSTIKQIRKDLEMPGLSWYVSQQPPTDHERVNRIDVVGDMERLAAADPNTIHIKAFDLPAQEKKLVLDTNGVVALGELLAKEYLK